MASLVIGGTGMLAAATRWLAERHPPTLLVSWHAGGFDPGNEALVPLELDWSRAGFVEAIAERLRTFPSLHRALLWIHGPDRLIPDLAPLLPRPGTVLVLGSASGGPGAVEVPDGIVTVRLGSVATATGRRWLTHEEISAGAVAALADGRPRVVGELVPGARM